MRASSAIIAALALVLLATSGAQPDSPDRRHDDKAIGVQHGLAGSVLFTRVCNITFVAVPWRHLVNRCVLFADVDRRVPFPVAMRYSCAQAHRLSFGRGRVQGRTKEPAVVNSIVRVHMSLVLSVSMAICQWSDRASVPIMQTLTYVCLRVTSLGSLLRGRSSVWPC